ncbi:MAG TPA: M28 family metallopeptidase [Steroidobacteraceae bacterium]
MRLFLFCVLMFLGSLATGDVPTREPWELVGQNAIRSHVEFLASDLLEGRAAASRGYDIAAAYVAAQFRHSGLKPAGDDETFYQTVPLLEATPVLPGSSAELRIDGELVRFEYGTDYLPSADFSSASSTVSAPLVFAGFGIHAPELDHDDFENVDVNGRIAVVFTGAPPRFPNNQRAYYSWLNGKFATLIERGAVGAVLVDSPDDAQRTPWERKVAMSWTPQMRWIDEQGAPHDAFEQLKLRFRFNQTAAARLFEYAGRSFDEILANAAAGEVQGFELPGLLTLSATTGLRRTESVNVLALLPGADPVLKRECIVVTAHLDHLGRGAAVDGDSTYNGAHDNAVGVGILLEMARALSASGKRPRRSILFAAVTAEEKGLVGSDYLAAHPPAEANRFVANINVDMPMTLAPTLDLIARGEQHSTLGSIARTAAAAHGYRLSPDPAPEQVSFIRSDQFSFIRRGVPALVIGSGYKPRDKNVDLAALREEFLETHYHQPSDEAKLPIDYHGAADLARVNLRVIWEAANAAAAPSWKPKDFFGGKFPIKREP